MFCASAKARRPPHAAARIPCSFSSRLLHFDFFECYEKDGERRNEMDCREESQAQSEKHQGLSDADNVVL